MKRLYRVLLRDLFALIAFHSILTSDTNDAEHMAQLSEDDYDEYCRLHAEGAWAMADAAMRERDK